MTKKRSKIANRSATSQAKARSSQPQTNASREKLLDGIFRKRRAARELKAEIAEAVNQQADILFGKLLRKIDLRLFALNDLEERITRLEVQQLESAARRALQIDDSKTADYQVIPVQYYLPKNDPDIAAAIEKTLKDFLNDIQFEVVHEYPPIESSLFKRFLAKSIYRMSPEEVAEIAAKSARGIGVKQHDLPQAEVTLKQAEALGKVLETNAGGADFKVQLSGMHIERIDGKVLAISLTPKEMSNLESAPDRFRNAAPTFPERHAEYRALQEGTDGQLEQ